MSEYRIEKDSLGEVQVPARAYYGAQTQRALENFPISGLRMPREFIRALGLIKRAAAEANAELQLLDLRLAEAVIRAAGEVADGHFDQDFVVDVYQTGSATSSNMNANEIIANRAIELLGGRIGRKSPVHPNDHVNLGQSSNDVIPTAIHLSGLESIAGRLLPALQQLHESLARKAAELDAIVKIGRTHLQDAVPIRLGQEFSGYAAQAEYAIERAKSTFPRLSELALGGTAVGTGLNTAPGFAALAVRKLSAATGLELTCARNRFEALGGRDAVVEASGQLKTIAVSLMKIANDLRLLASGPRSAIGEIRLPSLQPGSSIMPGKVNPVIPESVMMLCATVMGNDVSVSIGGQHGNLELNTMMPMMAWHFLQSVRLLANGANNLAERCVAGIQPDAERAESFVAGSLAMATALVPRIGYDAAAKIAQEAHASDRTVFEVALERQVLTEEELRQVLDPRALAVDPDRS